MRLWLIRRLAIIMGLVAICLIGLIRLSQTQPLTLITIQRARNILFVEPQTGVSVNVELESHTQAMQYEACLLWQVARVDNYISNRSGDFSPDGMIMITASSFQPPSFKSFPAEMTQETMQAFHTAPPYYTAEELVLTNQSAMRQTNPFAPDNQRVALIGYPNTTPRAATYLYIIDYRNQTVERLLETHPIATTGNWSPDSRYVPIYNPVTNKMQIVDTITGNNWRVSVELSGIFEPQWSGDSRYLAAVSDNDEIAIVDMTTQRTTLQAVDPLRVVGWLDDTRLVYSRGQGADVQTIIAGYDKNQLNTVQTIPLIGQTQICNSNSY